MWKPSKWQKKTLALQGNSQCFSSPTFSVFAEATRASFFAALADFCEAGLIGSLSDLSEFDSSSHSSRTNCSRGGEFMSVSDNDPCKNFDCNKPNPADSLQFDTNDADKNAFKGFH
jgi:hypothetical protein